MTEADACNLMADAAMAVAAEDAASTGRFLKRLAAENTRLRAELERYSAEVQRSQAAEIEHRIENSRLYSAEQNADAEIARLSDQVDRLSDLCRDLERTLDG
jgi:predicted nuclease with TOPRIM domain